MFELADFQAHETVTWVSDSASGLRAVIALHSTARGPAMGGCRLWQYGRAEDAMIDALRLSRGMSLKNAMADLPLGGGKAVILGPVPPEKRAAQFHAFGRTVEALGGRYVTAEDVGVSDADMVEIARETGYVSGLPTSKEGVGGDPSPFTARGVLRGIEVVARQVLGRADLSGVRIAVQGTGHVGASLCRMLAERGAVLSLADVDAARCAALADELGAEFLPVGEILTAEADILAPCALGGAITDAIVPGLKVRAIAGAANNQLATSRTGELLREAGIVFAPDYVINAGGIVAVAAEYLGVEDLDKVLRDVDAIGPRTEALLEQAAREGIAPGILADRIAEEKIAAATRPA